MRTKLSNLSFNSTNAATPFSRQERSACGVGFIANRKGEPSFELLQEALTALRCVEHRGACAADQITGDGAGVMTDIPFDMFGYEPGSIAVATLFMPTAPQKLKLALKVFEETFAFMGLKVIEYRDVPIDARVLGSEALKTLPTIQHAVIQRPAHCRTDESFNHLLYAAKQTTRTKERESGIVKEFFFTSLSTTTIVYKALTRSEDLDRFYLDLQNPAFKTRFALFHRRFSTNTRTSWDKAQPFRLIGHNGEINTIAGNRTWAFAREHSLGLPVDELLTHGGISDTGSLNEMVEALKYRSSIPHVEDILAIMIPPADQHSSFYKFWSRAMEPWDGPAFITYSDGETIGARLDRNGFRPCRWVMTEDHFYLASEAGAFPVDESSVLSKGTLHAGSGVTVELKTGAIDFSDPSFSRENHDARFDAHLSKIELLSTNAHTGENSQNSRYDLDIHPHLFSFNQEDLTRLLIPMAQSGKEPIGSMGDTARIAVLSDQPRSLFDYFYQDFAQVTNPPLDYLREGMVTDLSTYIGRRPNIFAPKELIPPARAIEVPSPILSLSQLEYLRRLTGGDPEQTRLKAYELKAYFRRTYGAVGFRSQLEKIAKEAVRAVEAGASILLISDRGSNFENPPLPSLLVLRSVVNALNKDGLLLEASIVIESGEVRSTHDIAVLIGFGATAVCPALALNLIAINQASELSSLSSEKRQQNLIKALEGGLLKIMARIGISVVRSYHGARLFTALGLGKEIIDSFFPGTSSPVGGLNIDTLVDDILTNSEYGREHTGIESLPNTYQYKEHNRGTIGEKHSMTNVRSRAIHRLARERGSWETYQEYLKVSESHEPVTLRHLLALNTSQAPSPIDTVESATQILKRFGSGAMSFGAISAESQRDIIVAMLEIGGRSNSGEGGENPYYFIEGISASTKQIASGRFGLTAEYLIGANEFQIKVAQGAKPGEGGQLMGVKVNPEIARARHSNPDVDLISPPPLHDIYSIEDLKQLIYELKQFKPEALVSVKLVSGANIGTIAVGVAKAGADIIQISGHDGGTGAAPLSSMKHAGLPWELGLAEVHQALVDNNLRRHLTLRVDGALHTGKDIVIGALLGAEEFDFGKLLLVAQGCVMARICEKNTCPTGIATHDPKFKAKYKGTAEDIVHVLTAIAEDTRHQLSILGATSIDEIVGRNDLLIISELQEEIVQRRGIDLTLLTAGTAPRGSRETNLFTIRQNDLNGRILSDMHDALIGKHAARAVYQISTTDRAVLASLSAAIAKLTREKRLEKIASYGGTQDTFHEVIESVCPMDLTFTGSAGQGFAAFLCAGVTVHLFGQANDSVCKSMSGGMVMISPHPDATFNPSLNAILGNCALYGATGGSLFVHGLVGDRFAVRNSGGRAVVEGAGLHTCEYMTNGVVVILGQTSHNIGAGMTGGTLYLPKSALANLNSEYLRALPLDEQSKQDLYAILQEYFTATHSQSARMLLDNWETSAEQFVQCLPIKIAEKKLSATVVNAA
jgi:glutamate synthase domain-containing protein 2/glutamate synthase domain-containing protein 1/glutamate synthase domain-containing protein 3